MHIHENMHPTSSDWFYHEWQCDFPTSRTDTYFGSFAKVQNKIPYLRNESLDPRITKLDSVNMSILILHSGRQVRIRSQNTVVFIDFNYPPFSPRCWKGRYIGIFHKIKFRFLSVYSHSSRETVLNSCWRT